jgi:hypothetical protein
MSKFPVAFTDNTAHPSFVIYYFMTIMIPLAVLIRPYRSLCIDSIKGSVSHPEEHRSVTCHITHSDQPTQQLRCMINHVARLAASYQSPFLHIFQDAAARAYLRVQCGSIPSNVGPSTYSPSRKSIDPTNHLRYALPWMLVFSVSQRTLRHSKSSSPMRSCSNLPAQCRFLRRYSSRAQADSAPLLPVFNDFPSLPLGGHLKMRSPRSQNSQRPKPSRSGLMPTTVTGETTNSAPPSKSPVGVPDHSAFASTALEDGPLSISPEVHNTSRPPVTRPRTRNRKGSLFQRLVHLYMTSPHTSIKSLVVYHDAFPGLQSSHSYNFLLRLAIRHSAFGTAHALFRSMRASRVPEDDTTCRLCVRLLVREGRWPDAYNLVLNLLKDPPRPPFVSDGVPVAIWAELLGTAKRRAFRGPQHIRDPGMYNIERYRQVMRQLPKFGVSPTDIPPLQAVYSCVAALLRIQEREAARKVAAQFVTMEPKDLGLRLVHLHMAAEPGRRSLVTFYRALRDLRGFHALCPELEPNGTTLFLLLGHLKGAKQCGIIGHKLVRWFRRRWGNSVVSPRVERRMLALAVKEKRVDLIRQWMDCVKTRRKLWWMWSLEREVVDGWAPRRRSVTRGPELRVAKAGTAQLDVDRLLRRASRVLKSGGSARLTERVLRRDGFSSIADP